MSNPPPPDEEDFIVKDPDEDDAFVKDPGVDFVPDGAPEPDAGVDFVPDLSIPEDEGEPIETYYVSYRVESHPEGILKEELKDEKTAVCDSLLQIVMAHDENNNRKHYAIMSMDGKKNEILPTREQWEAWAVLTRYLSRNMDPNDVDGWMAQICNGVVEVLDSIKGKKIEKKIETGLVDVTGSKITR